MLSMWIPLTKMPYDWVKWVEFHHEIDEWWRTKWSTVWPTIKSPFPNKRNHLLNVTRQMLSLGFRIKLIFYSFFSNQGCPSCFKHGTMTQKWCAAGGTSFYKWHAHSPIVCLRKSKVQCGHSREPKGYNSYHIQNALPRCFNFDEGAKFSLWHLSSYFRF